MKCGEATGVLFSLILMLYSFNLCAGSKPLKDVEDLDIDKVVTQMVVDDLSGKATCFQGELKNFFAQLQETYGGRFAGDYAIYLQPYSSTVARNVDKFCSAYQGQVSVTRATTNKNNLEFCQMGEPTSLVVSVVFPAATTGTFEEEGMVFLVTAENTTTIVRDRTQLYENETATAEPLYFYYDRTTTYQCELLKKSLP